MVNYYGFIISINFLPGLEYPLTTILYKCYIYHLQLTIYN